MKRLLLPLLCLLLLLTGCGSPAPGASPMASSLPALPTRSADTPSSSTPPPTPSDTYEDQWWEALTIADLPADSSSGGNCRLLSELPGEDIALYGGPEPDAGVLLRKGDTLSYFAQVYSTVRGVAPELRWEDLDDDGDPELAVKYLTDDENGNAVYELHIYEWRDGVWIDHGFTEDLFRPLLEDALTYDYDGTSATLSAGRSSVKVWCDGDPGPLLPAGDLVFFRYESGFFTAVFGLRLKNLPQNDAATLTARLVYDGETFTLKDYQLISLGGV